MTTLQSHDTTTNIPLTTIIANTQPEQEQIPDLTTPSIVSSELSTTTTEILHDVTVAIVEEDQVEPQF